MYLYYDTYWNSAEKIDQYVFKCYREHYISIDKLYKCEFPSHHRYLFNMFDMWFEITLKENSVLL